MSSITEAPFQVQHSGSDCTKTKLNVAIKTDHEREGQRNVQGNGGRRYSQQEAFRTVDVSFPPKHDKSFPHGLLSAISKLMYTVLTSFHTDTECPLSV